MAISQIEFNVDDHIIQVLQDTILIFKNCDISKPPIEFDRADLKRIVQIAEEQLDD